MLSIASYVCCFPFAFSLVILVTATIGTFFWLFSNVHDHYVLSKSQIGNWIKSWRWRDIPQPQNTSNLCVIRWKKSETDFWCWLDGDHRVVQGRFQVSSELHMCIGVEGDVTTRQQIPLFIIDRAKFGVACN